MTAPIDDDLAIAGVIADLERMKAEIDRAIALLEDICAKRAPPLPTEDRLVTAKEAAFLVGVSYQTIWRWQSDSPDALGARRIGGQIRLSERRLLAFARREK
jgi:predicted DNA-binding transcriptional regulator AlpA